MFEKDNFTAFVRCKFINSVWKLRNKNFIFYFISLLLYCMHKKLKLFFLGFFPTQFRLIISFCQTKLDRNFLKIK